MITTLTILLLVFAVVSCYLIILLIQQSGAIVIRLDALERDLVAARLRESPLPTHQSPSIESEALNPRLNPDRNLEKSRLNRDGLAPGSSAPPFTLPRANGPGSLSLTDYRGHPILLVFGSVDCAPCDALLSRLSLLTDEFSKSGILLVSRGSLEENSVKLERYRPSFAVVLQNAWEVSRQYATFKTPSGYLIDAEGVIRSELVVGPEALIALAFDVAERCRLSSVALADSVPANRGSKSPINGGALASEGVLAH